MKRSILALFALVLLSGCGGMTRAVAVLPDTTDDLARKSEAFRKPAAPAATDASRTR